MRKGLLVLCALLVGLPAYAHESTVILAGGCMTCLVRPLAELDGVLGVTTGYTGGLASTANHDDVMTGTTRHYVAVEVRYNPDKASFEDVLRVFWHNVDPFDADGQFCERGKPFLPAVFHISHHEKLRAVNTRTEVEDSLMREVAVPILPRQPFYPAEAEYQNFAEKEPAADAFYGTVCGRRQGLKAIWGN